MKCTLLKFFCHPTIVPNVPSMVRGILDCPSYNYDIVPMVKFLPVTMTLMTVDSVVTPAIQSTLVPFRSSLTELIVNVDTKGATWSSDVREKINLVELSGISVKVLLVETDRVRFTAVAFPGIAIIQSNTVFIVVVHVSSTWSPLHTCAIPCGDSITVFYML